MILSKKLLEGLFPIFKKIPNEKIEETLLLMGCEIESKKTFEKIENLIVGEIINVEKHPKTNNLNLCKVLVNNKEQLIVCGAHNVVKGAKVIVALENAKMIDGRVIQYRKIMDVVSEGMICAYNELTNHVDFLSDDDKDNIIILDENAVVNDVDPLKYIQDRKSVV